MTRYIPLSTIAAIIALILTLFSVSEALAGGNIGGATCTQADLQNAINSGGTVDFTQDCTIVLSSQITINTNVTINGNGYNVVLNGNNAVRVLQISAGTVVINDLVLTNGRVNDPNDGGGLLVSGGSVTLNRTTVSNNFSGSRGGGIEITGGSLTLDGALVAGNHAVDHGGALQNVNADADVIIRNSTFSGNHSDRYGGAIYFHSVSSSSIVITNSTFFNNSGERGGAIRISNDPIATLSNVTIGNNQAIEDGGGLYIDMDLGQVSINNSTIISNTADADAGGDPGDGGGIYVGDGPVNFANTIVISNTDRTGDLSTDDCSVLTGPFTNNGHNLTGAGTGCPTGASGDVTTATPSNEIDDNLADNGGQTFTFALIGGSQAINNGNNGSCEATDQRGYSRPDTCDIGAFEFNGTPPALPVADVGILKTVTPGTASPGAIVTYTLAFSNTGSSPAANVTITDTVPVSLSVQSVISSSSVAITRTSNPAAETFAVADLGPGQGGLITLTAVLSDPLAIGLITNTAEITTTTPEDNTANNQAVAVLEVSTLLITEIMYDNSQIGADQTWEWIEIYNFGPTPVDLAGYVLDDDDDSLLGGANIATGSVPPGGNAILINGDDNDAATFRAAWGQEVNVVPVTSWSTLGNSGDQVGLWSSLTRYNDQDFAQTIDLIDFDNGGDWPTDNNVSSIYLVNLSSDNNDGANWALSTTGGTTPVFRGYQAGFGGGDIGSPGPTTDLHINKVVSPAGPHFAGDTLTYTLTFSNSNDGLARNVVITDMLPLSVTVQNVVSSSTVVLNRISNPTSEVFTAATIGPGEGGLITLTAQISPAFTDFGPLTNTVTITSTTFDTNAADNQAATGVTVQAPIVAFSQANYQVNEDGSPVGLAVTINRSSSLGDSAVTVTAAGGVATSGSVPLVYPEDYDNSPQPVIFADGEISKTVTIPINDDTIFETTEQLTLTLTAPLTATLGGQSTASLAIIDNDPAPTLSITDISASEDSGSAVFTTSLSAESGVPITVTYQTVDQSATVADSDYSSIVPTTLNFPAGNISQTVTVTLTADAKFELDETFVISLTNPLSATIADGQGTGTIINDDSPPEISIADSTGPENIGTLPFTVTLSTASGADTGVNYITFNGAAETGDDYVSDSGVLTITAGLTQSVINIDIVDDAIDEGGPESFSLNLSGAINGNIIDSTASGTIIDDDSAGVTIAVMGGITVTEGGAADSYTIALNSVPTQTVTALITPDGQLDLGSGPGLTISHTFAADASALTPYTLTVNAVDDAIDEGVHSATLIHSFSSVDPHYQQGSVPITPSALLDVNIIDNDTAAIFISSISGDTTEMGGTASFTAVLASQPISDVLLTMVSDDPGEGTISPSGIFTLTFTPANWHITQTVVVTGVDDLVADGDQTYTVTTSVSSADPDYAALTPADVIDITNIDDDTANLSFTPTSLALTEGTTGTYAIALTSEPAAAVTITLVSDSELEALPTTLIFTPLSWNQPQTITISAIEDNEEEGTHTGHISHSLTSADLTYNGLASVDFTVNLFDKGETLIYLPLVLRNTMSTDAPDLIIENLIAASDAVTIVIRNAGTAPVPEDQGFWVDFYINPNPPPTQVNEVWNDGRAAAGMVWGVDGPILSTLTPGGVITLTVGDTYYVADPDHSNFPGLTAGDTVYVQVDSVNLATNYGNVLESHELLNDSYNNIFTTATIAVSSENLFIPNRSLQIEQPAPIIEGLPQRP